MNQRRRGRGRSVAEAGPFKFTRRESDRDPKNRSDGEQPRLTSSFIVANSVRLTVDPSMH